MNTFTTVKVLSKHKRICQKNELCIMKFSEEKTFKNRNYFKKILYILEFIVMVNVYVNITQKTKAEVLKKYIIKNQSNFVTTLNLI